jgi:glycosyltransferase involved in cell wall biosynthesis
MKVVFVHPSYPSQFTHIAHLLGECQGWESACLVHEGFTDVVRQDKPPIAYYGFHEESNSTSGSYYTQSIEEGMRRGKAVAEALAHLQNSVGVDVVVGHASFGTTFFVRQLLDLPVVSYVELPGYFPIYCRQEFPAQYPQKLIDVSLRALIHASVVHSDVCIVPSRYAKQLFPPELRSKIRIQLEGFCLPALESNRAKLRQDLGLEGTGPIVGFAGRTLEAVRGFDIFVKVAKHIRRVRPDVQFLVIGDETTLYGNEAMYLNGQSFKQHVLQGEGVDAADFIFKPFMPYDQFARHLQAMDVILFPLFEGAANWGVFEAMAAGVPILASNCCFIPEAITDGRHGLLFDPVDVRGFAVAALAIVAHPERFHHLGRAARQVTLRRFSLPKAVKGYASILREAVERHGRANATRQQSRCADLTGTGISEQLL